MKKLISIFLLVAMLISVIPCVALSAAADGETTTAITPDTDWWDNKTDGQTEFTLEDEADLLGFAKLAKDSYDVNSKDRFQGAGADTVLVFKLAKDMDLNPGWDANSNTVPTNIWPTYTKLNMQGTFDGQGHTIKGIYQDNSTAGAGYGGIFGGSWGRSMTVKNLTILNSYSKYTDMNCAGFLFGNMTNSTDCTIENVYVDARMVVTDGDRANNHQGVGGFIGAYNMNNNTSALTIKNSVFAGSIEVTGGYRVYVGGMVGRFNGSSASSTKFVIENCASYAKISLNLTDGGTVNASQSYSGKEAFVAVGGFLAHQSYAKANTYFTIRNCVSDVDFEYTASGATTEDKVAYGAACGSARYNTTYSLVNFDNILTPDTEKDLLGCASTWSDTAGDTVHGNTDEKYTASLVSGSDTKSVKADTLTGIAAQETLTANNLTGWTATTMGKVLPRALVVNVPGVVETTVANAATVLEGYQTKDADGSTFDFRLVATVDVPENVTVDKVGFVITANYGTTTLTKDYSTNTVYEAVTGDTETGLVDYTAEALGGDYIFALAITGAPVLTDDVITLEVTTYYVSGTTTVYGATEVFTVTAPQDTLN